MKSAMGEVVQYQLPLYDILEPNHYIPLNELVGQKFRLTFENAIHCVVSGKKINKVFGEGMSYDAFMNSPEASPSIIRPELSRIHEGIALRDYDWEMEHHMQPHYAYLSNTSGLKIGVTRTTQVPTRWIDQGASQAIVIAATPYRQAAGLVEVALKAHLADKTNWQKMLKSVGEPIDLAKERNHFSTFLPDDLKQWIKTDSEEMLINYPVLSYPEKVKSVKLDSMPEIEGTLTGIKGQYWMIDNSFVINIRSHAGYRVSLEF
ncbi:MAG: DUF2797 domain-containing protein [Bacteroidia bacterium]